MHSLLVFVVVVALATTIATATATARAHGVAWEDMGPAPSDTVHKLVFAMKAPEAQAAAFAEAVSARTGAHHAARLPALSLAELGAFVRPPPEQLAAVYAWLRRVGATAVSETVNADFVVATVTAGSLSAALGNEPLHLFRHRRSGRHIIRGNTFFVCVSVCVFILLTFSPPPPPPQL
jgi:hypothetical protein